MTKKIALCLFTTPLSKKGVQVTYNRDFLKYSTASSYMPTGENIV